MSPNWDNPLNSSDGTDTLLGIPVRLDTSIPRDEIHMHPSLWAKFIEQESGFSVIRNIGGTHGGQ